MESLSDRFRREIVAKRLIQEDDPVILAYSGGKDSTALLDLLLELRRFLPFRLRAAYFNHGLRPDAAAEEAWVRTACARLDVELDVGSRDVHRFRAEEKLNLEHAASLSRYEFLARTADRVPGTLIATAHTRSDLTETFFIKLFRGSGLQGLTAVHQRKYRRIIRPLLLFGEQDIRAHLESRGLEYYQDPTNLDPVFLRNRIRLELLPQMRRVEPAIEEKILQTVTLLQEEFDFFAGQAQRLLDQHLIGSGILPVSVFTGLHAALRRHLAREYLRRIKGDLLGVSFAHVEEFLAGLENGGSLSLPGADLHFTKGWLRPHGTTLAGYRLELAGPGKHPIPAICRTLSISSCARFRKPKNNSEIVVSRNALTFPLTLRNASAHDKYRKLNAAWKQNVFETIRVAGFPADLRPLCPLLENGDGHIVWVANAPIADEFKVTADTPGPFWKIKLQT